MKKIIHFLHVTAAPRVVYDALTTQGGLSSWWSTDVKAESDIGGLIDFYFSAEFHPDMEITNLEKDHLVEWKCVGGHDNWQNNTFSFELRGEEGATKLMFNQNYAQELSDEIYGTYNFNWGYYLNSLKKYCETGAGTPFSSSARYA